MPLILPGQTVRDYCYPIFNKAQMREIDAKTTAELVIDLRVPTAWTGPSSRARSTTSSSHNGWMRTDLPEDERLTFEDWHDNDEFLAAFVTPQGPKTQKLAKQLTKGTFTVSDEGAMEALSGVFYGLRDAGYAYITEPDSYWTEDPVQHVQFPSETIAHRAGNCVDLSVLFASLLEAVDVRTWLLISAGHCQVGIEMPGSGSIIPVEATLVEHKNATLQDAFDVAWEDYETNTAEGTYMFMDVRGAWQEGWVPTW